MASRPDPSPDDAVPRQDPDAIPGPDGPIPTDDPADPAEDSGEPSPGEPA